jgi:hypothetical protein
VEYFTQKTPEQTQTIRVGLVLASRRDAPAGLIQWGDDPSTTRYGLRSFQCFEAHNLFAKPYTVDQLSHALSVYFGINPAIPK